MIPMIDLASPSAATDLADSMPHYGIVTLTNHGIDDATIARQRTAADAFFELAVATKQQYVVPDPLANRGFRAKGSEALAYSLGEATAPDLFESFNAGTDSPAEWSDLVRPTPWPDDVVADFRPATLSLLEAFAEVGRRLDALIGETLGVAQLDQRSTCGPDMVATIDYRPNPDGTEPVVDGQLRMGAHSDYTTYTLLLADPVPGLQIVGPDGGWLDVVPEQNTLQMFVGDLLAMWTNDLWPSTLHRVIPIERGAAARRRSVAWFHYPDPDVEVEPLPRFTKTRPARYSTVRVDDHVRGKLASPKTQTLPTSASTAQDRSW